MAGRFPFDPNNPNHAGRVTNAQMRAALGLPSVDELSANLYVEQQQRLEAQQRDLRYRHALYQDQLDHQLQELQLRANAAVELEQLPEIQQRYANLLLSERLARGAEVDQAAVVQQRLGQEQLAAYRRQHAAALEQHYAQIRHQEILRQQQQVALQAHLARGAAHHHGVVPGLEQLVLRSTGSNVGVLSNAAAAQPAKPLVPPQLAVPNSIGSGGSTGESVQEPGLPTAVERPAQNLSRSSSADSNDSVLLEDKVIEEHKKKYPDLLPQQEKKKLKKKTEKKNAKRILPSVSEKQGSQPGLHPKEPPSKRRRGRPKVAVDSVAGPVTSKKKDKAVSDDDEDKMRAEAILQIMAERFAGIHGNGSAEQSEESLISEKVEKEDEDKKPAAMSSEIFFSQLDEEVEAEILEDRDRESPILRMGTVEGLLVAAKSQEKMFDVVHVLEGLKRVEWPDSDDEAAKVEVKEKTHAPTPTDGLPVPLEPFDSVITTMLISRFPKLPAEPTFDEEIQIGSKDGARIEQKDERSHDKQEGTVKSENEDKETRNEEDSKTNKADGNREKKDDGDVKKSNVLDYPYPVDTWWPSTAGRRRERRLAGETSDEDNFEEPNWAKGVDAPFLRCNEPKIRHRFQTELEPGVLEKLPHCRIHRMKRKNTALAELLYCFQVTECYPKDVMVCCSICGTWRHAACGGHYEPYSVRRNVEEPFIAICEQCYEEQRLLDEYPLGKARIERQRMEQLRRGLATTAVMRSMSFSKHGGTYKWPLGSVSATHVGGHTRSVQARHDKAEKQWADLLTRLGRGYGYRSKERQRVRTKELERLLVAIEDAEGQTDRHNMLLFLMRDTQKPMPTGFEDEHKNLFDPAYTDEEFDSLGYIPSTRRSESRTSGEEENREEKVRPKCLRQECKNKARFDSRFCSDGCGLHVVEKDLLRAFYESNDIHPSVLRSHY